MKIFEILSKNNITESSNFYNLSKEQLERGIDSLKDELKTLPKDNYSYKDKSKQLKKWEDRLKEVKKSSVKESEELPENLVKQYEERAANERKAGGSIDINYGMPTISVKLSDGSDYFFQEHEASNLLDEVPDNISAEDFILASAQNW